MPHHHTEHSAYNQENNQRLSVGVIKEFLELILYYDLGENHLEYYKPSKFSIKHNSSGSPSTSHLLSIPYSDSFDCNCDLTSSSKLPDDELDILIKNAFVHFISLRGPPYNS